MRYRTQVAIEIFLYDSESEGEKLELDLCLWEASMSRLDYARYSESLYEQHTSDSPYDRLIEKVGFPMTEERQKN